MLLSKKWNVTLAIPFSAALLFGGCGGQLEEPVEDDEQSTLGEATVLTMKKVMNLAKKAGVPCSQLVNAGAIAKGESSLETRALHRNTDGSVDRGLWQINSVHGYSEACLYDPECNAGAMAKISNKGSNWRPWLAYTNGSYKKFLSEAQNVYNSGIGGCR